MRAALLLVAACGGHGAHAPDACTGNVVFLNRAGGMYDRGTTDDPTRNLSTVVDGPRMIPAFPGDDATWNEITACIRDGLAPFPIEVTDIDPGTQPHVEIVFTTTFWAGPPGVTNILPATCRPGNQIEFVFGSAIPTTSRACHVALMGFAEMTAQLSPVGDCHDFLNNSDDCSPTRSFLNSDLSCVGDANTPSQCRCGGTIENTFQRLLATFPACQ